MFCLAQLLSPFLHLQNEQRLFHRFNIPPFSSIYQMNIKCFVLLSTFSFSFTNKMNIDCSLFIDLPNEHQVFCLAQLLSLFLHLQNEQRLFHRFNITPFSSIYQRNIKCSVLLKLPSFFPLTKEHQAVFHLLVLP